MSKTIPNHRLNNICNLGALLFTLSLILTIDFAYGRETKREKEAHAKNLRSLFFTIDTLTLELSKTKASINSNQVDNIRALFKPVSIKLGEEKKKMFTQMIDALRQKDDLRTFRRKIAEVYAVKTSPARTPDKPLGKKLYNEHCSVCHGESGAGDGVFSKRLNPAPGSLLEPRMRDNLTVLMVYNYLLHGLPSGVMKPLGEILTPHDLWSLSFFVPSLYFEEKKSSNERLKSSSKDETPMNTSTGYISSSAKEVASEKNLKNISMKDLSQLSLSELDQTAPGVSFEDKAYLRTERPYEK